MRASMAYLAGAGTIIAAIAIGLGGGLIAGDILNPQLPREAAAVSKLERRTMAETVGASTAAAPARTAAQSAARAPDPVSYSDPVPYLAETQRAGFGAVLASAEPASEKASVASNSRSAAQQTTAGQQASGDRSASPEDAYARAKDSDLRRSAAERRRAERHQRWVERQRRSAERHRRDWREQGEWGDADRRAREDASSRDNARPADAFPQLPLFGDED